MSAKSVASFACVAIMLVAMAAQGTTAQRTFVASNGNDVNPCSIAQPCRSFATAIDKTLVGGEVVVLDSAGYGVVTIAKSVSIITPPGVYAGVSVPAGQTGFLVEGSGNIVVLRGLTINGTGGSVGVRFTNSGSRLRIENCVVSGLSSTGIAMDAAASELVVTDTIVRDNGGAGISIAADSTAVLDNVRIEHNGGDGVFVAAVTSLAVVTIRNSVMAYNGQAGAAFTMAAKPAVTRFAIESSAISRNGADGIFAGGNNTGQILGVVRRNVIVGNGLSGISAFNLVDSGQSSVQTADNSFSGNGTYAISVQGYPSQVYSSANIFEWGDNTFFTSGDLGAGSGYQATYGDNTGESKASGPPPAPFSKF
jgi:hypothetical protein